MKISCSPTSPPSPTVHTFAAFSPISSTPSPRAMEVTPAAAPCPLSSSSRPCEWNSSLMDHLTHHHRAKHYDAQFDDEGIADIQFETSIPLAENTARKTAILLSLPTGEVACWTIETKRRADGELQASAAIQLIDREKHLNNDEDEDSTEQRMKIRIDEDDTTNTNRTTSQKKTDSMYDDDTGYGRSSSSTSAAASNAPASFPGYQRPSSPPRPRRLSISFPSSPSSPRSPRDLRMQQQYPKPSSPVETIYHATISAAGATTAATTSIASTSSTDDDETLQWRGVLSSSRPSSDHEYLTSHGGALVVLYPTNNEAFRISSRINHRGEEERSLQFPVKLRISKKESSIISSHSPSNT